LPAEKVSWSEASASLAATLPWVWPAAARMASSPAAASVTVGTGWSFSPWMVRVTVWVTLARPSSTV